MVGIRRIGQKVAGVWNNPETMGQRVARGGVLLSIGDMLKKVIQISRSIIIARILFPDDFGLFGLATLTLAVVDMVTQTGFESSIIQKKDLTSEELDSQWSVNVIRGFILGAVIFFVAAPLAAGFFNNVAVKSLVRALALMLVIEGFRNMGVFLFDRDLELNKKFYYDLVGPIAGAVTAIVMAFLLRNVWALVFGWLASITSLVVASYVMHSYRPCFTLDFSGAKRLFRFGRWIAISTILTFFVTRGDYIVIGKLLDTETLGFYQYAFTLGLLPMTVLTQSFSSMLFPLYSKIQDDIARMRSAFVRVARFAAALLIPAAVGFWMLADSIILRLIGEKWLPLIPMLSVTLLIGVVQALETMIVPLFYGVGKPRFATHVTMLRFGVMFSLIVPLTQHFGAMGTALAFLLGVLASTLWFFFKVRKEIGVGVWMMMQIALLPIVASVIMGGTLHFFVGDTFLTRFMIVAWVILGATVYGGALFGLDRFFGQHYASSLLWIKHNI